MVKFIGPFNWSLYVRFIIIFGIIASGIGTPASAGSPPYFAWQPVGNSGFSTGIADYESLFVFDGAPYVAYYDVGNNGITVMKYSDSSWQPVGSPGILPGGDDLSLFVDNGIPYVAYYDLANGGKATVMKFTSGSWQPVGNPGFSAGEEYQISLYVYQGTPYVAYCDLANGRKATLMKYTGDSWQPVGNPGFSAGETDWESLFVYDGTPYVAYQDGAYGGKATVMKFTSGSWEPVGNPGFSAGITGFESLYVYDGIPYLAYSDDRAHGFQATVMAYDGSSWHPVGNPGFSSGEADWVSLFVYAGTPYVAYEDWGNGGITVMNYSEGSWQPVGSPGLGGTGFPSLYVYDGSPYVAYMGTAFDYKATVMEFTQYTPAIPAVTGVTPKSGPATVETWVTITGDSFTGATGVMFGTTPAARFAVNSASQITAICRANSAGIVDVKVTTLAGTSSISPADEFTYLPIVSSITPNSGPTTGGTSVTITGDGFTGATAVLFGNIPASSFIVNSATEITAISPANSAGTIDVTVIIPVGTSDTSIGDDRFTYLPIVTAILPNSGPTTGGTSLIITGNGFTGATGVLFGTIPASSFRANSATRITATSPAHSEGTIDITVITPGGTSAISPADEFTFLPGVPEFPTLVIPVAIEVVLSGAAFFFGRRRNL